MAQSPAERARRQRKRRLAAGWCEVKVWVPSAADAEEIRRTAARMRRRKKLNRE